jgi:serine/threonine protein kinase
MVTELCRSDLYDLISTNGALTDKHLLKGVFSQIVSAVNETHNAGICHLDIKLENILIAQDYNLRLCDYGFASPLDTANSVVLGTPGYMAPEISNEKGDYDGAKADIFSLGVLLYTMAFGNPPFGSTSDRFFRLIQNKPTKFFELHPRTRDAFK